MIYYHNQPESSVAKRDKYILKKIGANRKLILELQTGRFFNKHPARIRRKYLKEFTIGVSYVKERKVFTWAPKEGGSGKCVLYFHGGAYIHSILRVHWSMIAVLIRKTKATFVVPDYPLAPENTYTDAYDMMESVYQDLLATENDGLLFMGDSAGGGLALGLAQKLRDEGKTLPEQLILLSPWLDVTMTHPESMEVQGKDILLKMSGLIHAGRAYAGKQDPKHPMISPIYGSFTNLPPISFFSSTYDILIADAHELRDHLVREELDFNYYEYPKMFHGWMAIVHMPEAIAALEQISALILTEGPG